MIFYFTGTGNSLWVAEALSKALDEPLISIAEELGKDKGELAYSLGKQERVLFVFPIHSWGPAVPVQRFVARLRLYGYTEQAVYSVCTCGDDCGRTDKIMRTALRRRGITLVDSYSVQMPNNYILLPGFDVDSKEVETAKLQAAPMRVATLVEAIRKRRTVPSLYHAGTMAAFKSHLIHPLFTQFAIKKHAFYATEACVSCGLCQRICPTDTISLSVAGKPLWKDTCVQCLACIHRCPTRAIEYGKSTLKKGRYHHPDLRNNK
ncbi:MAG: EFR1 family ferrodoxin [Tannerellaceae bacterium]